jgi:mycothiol synthase
MSGIPAEFQPIDFSHATEKEYASLSTFKNILNQEYRPDDPPILLEEHIQGWKNIPDFIEYEAYIAWHPSGPEIIAYCDCMIFHTGDNEHSADLRVEVLPSYRNRGIGRQALHLLLPFIKKNNRTLLISFTSDLIRETAIWFEHLHGRRGLRMHVNQLRVSEFNKTLLDMWLAERENKRSEFDAYFLSGPYPDDRIDQIAALFQKVGNDSPRDELQLEDFIFTPEILRQEEKNLFSQRNLRWTMYLIDRNNGNLAGLTEVFWNPNRPMILNQAFTGVYPAYRNHGLGRWLKAEMMNKILLERPEVEFIRTNNANSNGPMLKINTEMGFKPYLSNTIWQVDTADVETYLKESRSQ